VLNAIAGGDTADSPALAALAAACDEVLVIAPTREKAQTLIDASAIANRKLTPVGTLSHAD
jgi:hypothetical protein